MKAKDVIRAWKNAEFRQRLSEADQAKLPAHPAGMIELTDADLGVVSGGCANTVVCTTVSGSQCNTQRCYTSPGYTRACCQI